METQASKLSCFKWRGLSHLQHCAVPFHLMYRQEWQTHLSPQPTTASCLMNLGLGKSLGWTSPPFSGTVQSREREAAPHEYMFTLLLKTPFFQSLLGLWQGPEMVLFKIFYREKMLEALHLERCWASPFNHSLSSGKHPPTSSAEERGQRTLLQPRSCAEIPGKDHWMGMASPKPLLSAPSMASAWPVDFIPARALSYVARPGSWVPAEKLQIWGRRLLFILRRNERLKWWLVWDHCFIKSVFNVNTTGPRCHNDELAGRKECAGF